MNLRPRRDNEPEISLTPLIDVVFLLLIFFMVSTTFERHADLNIELPRAEQEPTATPDEAIEIIIDAEGRYFVNEGEHPAGDRDRLRDAISEAVGEYPDAPVIIRADANASHQAVITAMDVVSQLGIARMSIATSHDDERD